MRKKGKDLICPNCNKIFYAPLARLLKSKNHYCSAKCASQYTAPIRSAKQRKKDYPFVTGTCLYCKNDIVVHNSGFDKPNRKFCSVSCKTSWRNKNIPQSENQRVKSSERAKKTFTGMKRSFENKIKNAIANTGGKSHYWKGGYTPLARRIRNSNRAVEWRQAIFEKDNYCCTQCGRRNGNGYNVYLEADHIVPFSFLFNKFISNNPEKNQDKLFELAIKDTMLWDTTNGRTLCRECHRETTTFSHKAKSFILHNKGHGIYKKIVK